MMRLWATGTQPTGVPVPTPEARGLHIPRQVRRAVHYVLLTVVLFLTVMPLLWMVVTSLRGRGENMFAGASILPSDPSIDGYHSLFRQIPVLSYAANTMVVVTLSLLSQGVFASCAGYALSRKHWLGRNAVFMTLVASIMVPFEAIMVSLFLMVNGLGLIDNLLGVWLPALVTPVNILIMRAAFMAVPDELEDAAVLDGAGEWTRFRHIFLPQARGALVVVAITTFISVWDDFLWPLLVIRRSENFTLTLGLAQLATTRLGYDERVVMAGAVVSIIPILVLFALAQRHFYRGVAGGGLKM